LAGAEEISQSVGRFKSAKTRLDEPAVAPGNEVIIGEAADRRFLMPWPDVKIKDFAGFVEKVAELNRAKIENGFPALDPRGRQFIYRGHSKFNRKEPEAARKWRLLPTLGRIMSDNGISAKEARAIEQKAVEEFQQQSHSFLESRDALPTDDEVGWWMLMQHHHAPTRLLDWTFSPYVGLFFAVQEQTHWNCDGAVWYMNFEISNKIMKEWLPHPKENSLPRLSDEQPLAVVRHGRPTTRILSQLGVFSYCNDLLADHEETVEKIASADEIKRGFGKIIIPKKRKPELLLRLQDMNITARTLYQDMDGVGRSVAETVCLMAEAQKAKKPGGENPLL
jgi:hypothetical protein